MSCSNENNYEGTYGESLTRIIENHYHNGEGQGGKKRRRKYWQWFFIVIYKWRN